MSRFQFIVASLFAVIALGAHAAESPCKVYSFKGKLVKKQDRIIFLVNAGAENEVQVSLPTDLQVRLEKKIDRPLELITPATKLSEYRYQASYSASISRSYPAVINFQEHSVVETQEACPKQ